jgi:hypothetical protein
VGEPVTTLAAASASSSAEPGTLAFLVVFGMAVVLTVLFRSMSKHLRKVNSAPPADDTAGADGTAAQATAKGPAQAGSQGPAADAAPASSGDWRRDS